MADYRQVARRAALKHGIDPKVFERQIAQESGFNPNARSSAGAQGIAQFMPATAKGMGIDPMNPEQALDGAARLMAGYQRQYGNTRDALVAYNAGPGRVGKALYPETRAYVSSILGNGSASGGQTQLLDRMVSSKGGASVEFDQAGYQDAQRKALLGRLMANQAGAATNPLLQLGVVSPTMPDKQSFYKPVSDTSAEPQPQGVASGVNTSHTGMPTGVAVFEGTQVAAWIKPYLVQARKQGWAGKVSSGWRSTDEQRRIYEDRTRTLPAARPGTSNHEGTQFPRGAVDVTDPEQLNTILRRKGSPLKWAGSKDPVHFSAPHNGSY